MSENLYDILGVSKSASADEIKKAYKKLAIKHHPDKGGDEEVFKKISNAYSILSDENKKAEYDLGGRSVNQNGRGFSAEDFFSQFFRGGQAGGFGGGDPFSRGVKKGNSLQHQLNMTFEEIYNGASKKIEFYRDSMCEPCQGNGSMNGNSFNTCYLCKGSGRVLMQHGHFHIENVCHICNGNGRIISSECTSCSGVGIQKNLTSLVIDIPKGVPDGWKTAIAGYGHFPQGGGSGQPGDLYIIVKQLEHVDFERDGDNIVYKAKMSFTKAALGGKIEVPTLEDKKMSFDISECTPPNKLFRLKDKGFPSFVRKGFFGDLLVVTEIDMPKSLTDNEKNMLKQLSEEANFKN
jgi:molecular chaperone DnaJ